MSYSPAMTFHIPGAIGEIRPGSFLWDMSLSEKAFDPDTRSAPGDSIPQITIGDYFLAARRFLDQNNCSLLKRAFRDLTGKPFVSQPHPMNISLSLEKHGAFYHPIKVLMKMHGHPSCSLVLNGAVSGPGLGLIGDEFILLSEMADKIPLPVIPRVYGQGRVHCPKGDIGFFLGEWFDSFKEFHVHKKEGEKCIGVWEDEGSIRYLSCESASLIYEKIAYVLTLAYDVETGEQVLAWHHAAGDFIVDPDLLHTRDELPVKLITVRGYGSLMESERGGDPAGVEVLTRLLFFFLNLSLRMQLDKLAGVGKTVFLGEQVVKATLSGFLKGLDEKSKNLPEDLRQVFMEFITGFNQELLFSLMTHIVDAQKKAPMEALVIQEHLEFHCRCLHRLFKTVNPTDFY